MSNKKPNNEHDYGYYGKGTTGYMHYKQDFDRNFSSTRNNHKSSRDAFIELFCLIGYLVTLVVGWCAIMTFFAFLYGWRP